MLPMMLLAWLFKGWKVVEIPSAGKTIQKIVNETVNGTLKLAVTGVFVTFAVMFLNAIFGDWQGQSVLITAIEQNDSKFLMDALMLRNDSLITIALMGIFIAMFMTMIPKLSNTFFKLEISQEAYETAKKNTIILKNGLKKVFESIKK